MYAILRVHPVCTLTSLTLIIVVSLQIFSVLNSDDASAPALETQPQGDEEGECRWGVVLGVGRGPGGAAMSSCGDCSGRAGLAFPTFMRPRHPS